MAFPQRGPGVGKLMGGINMLGFFFFKKKYSTVIPTKNLFEVKSGVRTIGESPEDSACDGSVGREGTTDCLSSPFSILSSCFPSPSPLCSSCSSFSSFLCPSLPSLPSLPSFFSCLPSSSPLLPLPSLPPLPSPSTTSFSSSFHPLSVVCRN